jgi:hypothetical protein
MAYARSAKKEKAGHSRWLESAAFSLAAAAATALKIAC